MRFPASRMVILGAPLLFTACATVQPPQPPSLDLPKPPTDLRAARKGSRVTLTWTVPSMTTDRQTARNLGPTRIGRGPGALKQCGTPIAKMPSRLSSSSKSGQKISDTYTDTLAADLQSDPSALITYAVEVTDHSVNQRQACPCTYRLPLIYRVIRLPSLRMQLRCPTLVV